MSRLLPARWIMYSLAFATALQAQIATPDMIGSSAARVSAAVPGYGNLPISFEANRGQTSREVQFISRGDTHTLYLTRSEVVLVLRDLSKLEDAGAASLGPSAGAGAVTQSVLRMRFVGARPARELVGIEELPGRTHYFIGNDPGRWVRDVPTYARVRCPSIYPGIDAVYHGRGGELEYDLAVAPGADPSDIEIRFEGADHPSLDHAGDLVLSTPAGQVRFHAPFAYQESASGRRQIQSSYVVRNDDHVTFNLAAYDHRASLIIDPVLEYSTYLGGNSLDRPCGIAVDGNSNAYVTGYTYSTDFPTADARQPSLAGASDRFVTKLNSTGTALIYSTYLGGSGDESGLRGGIAVDGEGNAYVTGRTSSTDFPTTSGAIKTTLSGFSDPGDAFLTKLDPTGASLLYSTYLGGSGTDEAVDMAIDGSGDAYITGLTTSTDFPTLNASQPSLRGDQDAFVTKFSGSGSGLIYSTYLGGSSYDWGTGIAVAGEGNAYVTGETGSSDFPVTPGVFQPVYAGGDAFVAKFDVSGSQFIYSTFLGGTGNDFGTDIAADAAGNAYVTGGTLSYDFPTANAFDASSSGADAFVTKIDATGRRLWFSTYLGGSASSLCPGQSVGTGIAIDGDARIHVTGFTGACDFPTVDPIQCVMAGGGSDAFVSVFSATGTALLFSTFLGGHAREHETYYNPAFVGGDLALDPSGNAYLVGYTESVDFPVKNALQPNPGGGNADAFVAKIAMKGGEPSVCDLEVIQRDSSDPVIVNSTFFYSVSVRNLGPSCAGNVVFHDMRPANTLLQYLYTSRNCSDSSGTIDCAIGKMAPGDSVLVTIGLSALTQGTIENVAWVTTSTPDANPENNVSAESTSVEEPRVSDVFIREAHSPRDVSVGSEITFTLDIGNHGPDEARDVRMSPVFYAPVRIVSVSSSRGTCGSDTTAGFGCSFGTMAAGESTRVRMVVIPEMEGDLNWYMYCGSSSPDPDYSNNQTSGVITVQPPPEQLLSNLIDLVKQSFSSALFIVIRVLKQDLLKNLEAARAALAAGDNVAACSALADFRHRVGGLSGLALTLARALDLDARASRIQSLLGCGARAQAMASRPEQIAPQAMPFSFTASRRDGGVRAQLTLPEPRRVRLDVFDVSGRLICNAFDGQLEAGSNGIDWNERRSDGSAVPDGVYFLRVAAGRNGAVARVVLIH